MNQLNQLIIEGTVVQKSNLTKLHSGADFCQFTLKNVVDNRTFSGKRETFISEFEIFAYDNLAKTVSSKKLGQKMRILGRLKQVKWVDYPNKERSRCVVVADHIDYKDTNQEEQKPQEK